MGHEMWCKEYFPFKDGDDVFECYWCERVQHWTCLQISSDQYSALSHVSSNICSLPKKLPNALSHYDGNDDVCSTVDKSILSWLKR